MPAYLQSVEIYDVVIDETAYFDGWSDGQVVTTTFSYDFGFDWFDYSVITKTTALPQVMTVYDWDGNMEVITLTITIDPPPGDYTPPAGHTGPPVDAVILAPAAGSAVGTLDPVTIEGTVFAAAGLDELILFVDGGPVYNQSFNPALTDSAWSTGWTPPGDGIYVLEAQVSDSSGLVLSMEPIGRWPEFHLVGPDHRRPRPDGPKTRPRDR